MEFCVLGRIARLDNAISPRLVFLTILRKPCVYCSQKVKRTHAYCRLLAVVRVSRKLSFDVELSGRPAVGAPLERGVRPHQWSSGDT